jgi:OOP family OmpA-OmpF porin
MTKKLACLLLLWMQVSLLYAQQKQLPNNNLQTLGRPINTLPFSEFAPTVSADGNTMIFESDRSGRWRLYITYQIKTGGWTEPKDLETINNAVAPGDFLGGPCISYDGSLLLFTSNMKGTVGGVDIWMSKRTGDDWSAPKNMGRTINSGNYDGFPSLSADGRWLYFMRAAEGNSPTGQRCCELYIAQRRGEFFINPKVLPAPINMGCEGYPRIMADGRTLIFSSYRPGGKGGYDLYESKYKNGKWMKPVPLEFINTPKDDELISVPASGDVIYLSSTMSNNKDDIYKIELPEEFRPDKIVIVEGKVTDEETKKVIPAMVKVSDIKKKQKVQEVENDPETGKYTLYLEEGRKYDVSVVAQGHTFESEVIDLENVTKYKTVKKEIKLKPLKVNTSFTLNNLFFDFDSSSLTKESELELERVIELLNTNPGMTVEISAHTDDKGSDEYNTKLSQHRAESVVRFLTQKGINKDRMLAKGYGESVPSVPNDSDENRAKNRRVEFKILKM